MPEPLPTVYFVISPTGSIHMTTFDLGLATARAELVEGIVTAHTAVRSFLAAGEPKA